MNWMAADTERALEAMANRCDSRSLLQDKLSCFTPGEPLGRSEALNENSASATHERRVVTRHLGRWVPPPVSYATQRVDHRPASNKHSIDNFQLFKRNGQVDRLFKDRRSTARDNRGTA